MKWAEINDKERVQLILQHVMGYFVLDMTATGWHTPEHPRGHEAAAIGFHWPIAFWNTDGECWMARDIATDPTSFDPLHDMNDACIIPTCPSFFGANTEIVCVPKSYWRCRIDFHQQRKEYHAAADTATEAICIAALRASGIEIEE